MTKNKLVQSKFAMLIVATGIVAASGCSTGLFKPVQPWPTNNAFVDNAMAAPPVQIENGSPYQSGQMNRNEQPHQNGQGSQNRFAGSRVNSRFPDNTLAAKPADDPTRNDDALLTIEKDAVPVGRNVSSKTPQKISLESSNRKPVQTHSATQPDSTEIQFRQAIAPRSDQRIPNPDVRGENDSSNQRQRGPATVPPSSGLKTPLYLGNGQPQGSQSTTTFYRSQSPQDGNAISIPSSFSNQSQIQQTAAQNPELQNGGVPVSPFQSPSINVGSPNELNPFNPGYAPSGSATFPQNYADLDIYVSETSTGRINFGGAYNSDSGLVGQFVIDERNFDILRLPRNLREIVDGTAWRGGGQNFRLELVPGSDVERYLVSFSEPFLFGSRVSFSSSLYYFQRQFFDYDEERLGGRFAFGYRLTPDISVSTGIRMENVEISDPRNMTSPTLNATLGDTDLYVGNVGIIRDTRDHPFLPTEGNYLSMTFSQGFGEFDYSRGDFDFRTYRLMYQRPDGSGRHTLSYGTKLGFSGSDTPFFENYFAGGFSTLRGFDFRGASPIEGDVRIGGQFQWLNTLEYTFPITADDMVKGVLFTDFGTVEDDIEIDGDNFRVAPGFGFRVHMPAAGIGAPLAFDFAFPVSTADGDDEEVFSFYLGVSR